MELEISTTSRTKNDHFQGTADGPEWGKLGVFSIATNNMSHSRSKP